MQYMTFTNRVRYALEHGLPLPTISGGDGSAPVVPGTVATEAFTQGAVGDAGDAGQHAAAAGFLQVPVPPSQPDPNAPGAPTTADINTATGKTFTEAEVEAARKQERDKLYATLEDERKRRAEAERQLSERQSADEAERQRQADEARAAAEAEMDARQFAETLRTDFETRLAEERAERERLEAALEQERVYAYVQQVRTAVIDRERENILPELIDMISGNTEEEIEQSVVSLRERTASILGNVTAATSQARQQMQGASVTAPPVGPLESQQQHETVTADDIRQMTPEQYAQNRERLLGAVSTRVRQSGIYGG
jgi:colicin import membrane protein